MIAWIQRYLIRRWFFVVLLTVIIVAFVLTITPAGSGLTGEGEDVLRRDFFGVNLASRRDVQLIRTAAAASIWINSGRRIFDESQLEQASLQRTALLAIAKDIGIPEPTKEEINTAIRSKSQFVDESGAFDEDAYTQFIDSVKADSFISEKMILQAVVEDHKIDRLQYIFSGLGFVLPYEAQKQVESNETVWSVQVARFDSEDFNPEIEIDEETLANYLQANGFKYEQPEQVQIDALRFSVEPFIPILTGPTEIELRAHFDRNPNLYRDPATPNGKPPEQIATNFESVREQVQASWVSEKAARLAAERADAFVQALYSSSVERDSSEFDRLRQDYGAASITIPPFPQNRVFPTAGIPVNGLRLAFSLSDQRYYSDVIQTQAAAFVLIYRERIAAHMPGLDEIREDVAADYRADERMRLFVEKGQSLKDTLDEGLKRGGSFSDLSEAEGAIVEEFKEFTMRTIPNGLNRTLFTQNSHLIPGQISSMSVIDDDGEFIFIADRQLPEDSARNTIEIENILRQIASINSYYATVSGLDLVSEIVARELERADAQ